MVTKDAVIKGYRTNNSAVESIFAEKVNRQKHLGEKYSAVRLTLKIPKLKILSLETAKIQMGWLIIEVAHNEPPHLYLCCLPSSL